MYFSTFSVLAEGNPALMLTHNSHGSLYYHADISYLFNTAF